MKIKKGYINHRLGRLKKLNRNYDNERKKPQKYDTHIFGEVPLFKGEYRNEDWVQELQKKMEIGTN
tara:strand:+ start:367 stop:564 length:198 start_codon:yes stop_codon:yes gene_type:complete